jgi:alpha-tubulin suppressor-like RCC1 family protein
MNIDDEPKRIPELSNIKDISIGPGHLDLNTKEVPAYIALNDEGQVYVWGDTCYASLMRPDFQDRKVPLCPGYGHDNVVTQADKDQASLPELALENVKAIRGSVQSLMVLMNDGKTINRYGNIYLMDFGMEKVVSNTPVTDFAGFDIDGAGNGDVRILSDKGHVPDMNKYNFRQFSLSYEGFYSLFLNQDGSVWGKSDWVDGTVQRILPLNNIVEVIAVAYNSGTALDKNGIVWTWGNRDNLPYTGDLEKFKTKVDAKPVQRQLSLKIDGKYIASNPGPIQMNGVTFVPVRALFESIGTKIGYANDHVTVYYHNQVLKMKVYNTNATLDGNNIQMPAAPLSYQGRTYVPARFIAQTLGAKVMWDAADGCVVIDF